MRLLLRRAFWLRWRAADKRWKPAVDEILPYVDEHYWLPLYGQAGLTAGAKGTTPVAGNPGRHGCASAAPIPCWSIFTEGHVTYDGRLRPAASITTAGLRWAI